jgi:hypothetical protein
MPFGICHRSSEAFGFHIVDDGKHGRLVGHGGHTLGGDTFALMYLDTGYTVIVQSNYDRPSARTIIDRIADMLIL